MVNTIKDPMAKPMQPSPRSHSATISPMCCAGVSDNSQGEGGVALACRLYRLRGAEVIHERLQRAERSC